jgi:hypothetical protein
MGGIVRTYPAHFLYGMRLKRLIVCCGFFVAALCLASDTPPTGFLEGRLRILAGKEVELAEGSPSKFGADYAEYPLVVLSQDGKQEIARVTADENGKYRVALRAGHYILDVHGRTPKRRIGANPKPFKVLANQTVHVDMDLYSRVP